VFRAAPPPRAVYVDGLPVPVDGGVPGWRARDGRVEVRVEDDGHARSIEIEPAP
jgi:hypothetical protein